MDGGNVEKKCYRCGVSPRHPGSAYCHSCKKKKDRDYGKRKEVKKRAEGYREIHKEELKEYAKKYYREKLAHKHKPRKKFPLAKEGNKWCSMCEEQKKEGEFRLRSRKGTKNQWLDSYCKECGAEYNKKYRENLSKEAEERGKAQRKEHREKNKEIYNERSKRWYAENKEGVSLKRFLHETPLTKEDLPKQLSELILTHLDLRKEMIKLKKRRRT